MAAAEPIIPVSIENWSQWHDALQTAAKSEELWQFIRPTGRVSWPTEPNSADE